jgi:hypothetical protein
LRRRRRFGRWGIGRFGGFRAGLKLYVHHVNPIYRDLPKEQNLAFVVAFCEGNRFLLDFVKCVISPKGCGSSKVFEGALAF